MNFHSKIIMGCMSWGEWGKKLSVNQQIDLIHFCVENGNNTFDHADIYGDYSTESAFGSALKKSQINRNNVHLLSKCGIQLVGKRRKNKIKHYNLSKEYIISSVDESLKNLQTEYLDTLLLHRPSPLMNYEEIAESISLLKKNGKIIHFGVSNFTPQQMDALQSHIDIECNQIEVSITNYTPLLDGTLDFMIKNAIPCMAWSPLGHVFKEENPQTKRINNVLNVLAKKYECKTHTLLLSWIAKHPIKMSPVIGTTNKKRILDYNKALQIDMEMEDWFWLFSESMGKKVP